MLPSTSMAMIRLRRKIWYYMAIRILEEVMTMTMTMTMTMMKGGNGHQLVGINLASLLRLRLVRL